jgi:basic amino acid/polyamine antiporter, APA family
LFFNFMQTKNAETIGVFFASESTKHSSGFVIVLLKIMSETLTKSGLIRGLGLMAAIAVIIGNVIGTGVFAKARVMTCNVGSPGWVIGIWIAAGFLSLAGALTYAELSTMKPEAGGEYNFLRDAYGRVWSFLFGWMQIFVAKTGSQAAVAVLFMSALNDFMGGSLKKVLFATGSGFEITSLQIIAVALIILITTLNCLSVTFTGQIATVLTFVKIGLIFFVGLGAFILVSGDFGHFSQLAQGGTCEGVDAAKNVNSGNYSLVAGVGAAMLAALWGYDGWNNLTMVAGEIKNPSRNIPIALIGGTIAIMFLYVFANVAYFYVLTPNEIASVSKDSTVAVAVVSKFGLGFGAMIMTVGLMLSSLGTLHTSIMTGARVPFAMAKDKMFFSQFGRLSDFSNVPIWAVVMQGIWASVLVLSGSFDTLTDYVIFGSWIFYAAATATVFVFRRTMPNAERPYRAFGYPIVPILFLLVAGFLLFNELYNEPQRSFLGLGLILLGLPVYYYFTKVKGQDNYD